MKKAHNGQEKRRYRRIKRKFEVKLRIHSKDASTRYGRHDMAFLQDISAGGALFDFDREIKIGTLIDLEIKFSLFPDPVKCLGRVIRVGPSSQPKAPGQPPLYHIAVRFIETADKREEQLLDRIVEEYHSKEMSSKE